MLAFCLLVCWVCVFCFFAVAFLNWFLAFYFRYWFFILFEFFQIILVACFLFLGIRECFWRGNVVEVVGCSYLALYLSEYNYLERDFIHTLEREREIERLDSILSREVCLSTFRLLSFMGSSTKSTLLSDISISKLQMDSFLFFCDE